MRARLRRRRRWQFAAAALGVLVVIGVPAVFAAVAAFNADDPAPQAPDDPGLERPDDDGGPTPQQDGAPDPDGPNTPDGQPGPGPSGESSLEPPDLAALDGVDEIYAALLLEIDTAEDVMMRFQRELAATFMRPDLDGQQTPPALAEVASEHLAELDEVRAAFTTPLDDPGADEVRAAYLDHVDSWVTYMDAVAQDPSVLAREGTDVGYTVHINTTADVFARTLDETMSQDLDASVRAFGNGILDRGFRGTSAPTV